jgi:hypothetical protein
VPDLEKCVRKFFVHAWLIGRQGWRGGNDRRSSCGNWTTIFCFKRFFMNAGHSNAGNIWLPNDSVSDFQMVSHLFFSHLKSGLAVFFKCQPRIGFCFSKCFTKLDHFIV